MDNKALAATSAALVGIVPTVPALQPQDFGSSIYESQSHSRILVRAHETTEPNPALTWLPDAQESLSKLASLKENWDSYGAKPIEPENLRQTLQVLAEVMQPEISFPWITPLASGAIQMEWEGPNDAFVGIEIDGNSATAFIGDEEFPLIGSAKDRVRQQVAQFVA